jgi:hypothetical protein
MDERNGKCLLIPYRPDMVIFREIHFEPCHAQTITLMQERLTHLEWIFCQLDGPNFVLN